MTKEEKLRKALDKRGYYNEDLYNEILDLFGVSGCLPSDKEIINKAKGKYLYKKTKEGTYYEGKCKGFIEGANWIKWKHEKTNNR